MDNGFIKIHRKMIKWEWFADPKTFAVFMFLLLDANHTDQQWRGNTINRGQTLTGRIKISDATGVSQQSVRTALSNLVSTNEITIQSTNRFSIITICNYNKYQHVKDTINQQPTNNQPATNQQPTTNKNEKNEKKEPKNIVRFAAPTLQEVQTYCLERKNQVDAEKFIDFYESKGWMVGRNKMKSWKASVRTWEKEKKDNSMKIGESTNSGRYRANDL